MKKYEPILALTPNPSLRHYTELISSPFVDSANGFVMICKSFEILRKNTKRIHNCTINPPKQIICGCPLTLL